ncbi:MAG: hypothetical protein ACI83B_003029, partial [Sediminicola sp.]
YPYFFEDMLKIPHLKSLLYGYRGGFLFLYTVF